jgi:predicted nucleic acid-binding protein
VIIADTSGLLALFNAAEPDHTDVTQVVTGERDQLVVSPFVLAELDYLVGTRIGVHAETAMLRELASGAYHLASIDPDQLATAADIVDRYRDQHIGLTDASLVVLAERFRTHCLLTLDRRHFTVVRPLSGGTFELLP